MGGQPADPGANPPGDPNPDDDVEAQWTRLGTLLDEKVGTAVKGVEERLTAALATATKPKEGPKGGDDSGRSGGGNGNGGGGDGGGGDANKPKRKRRLIDIL